MAQSEMSLYPKISPIYNKIMQLAIAIVLIVILMNIWVDGVRQEKMQLNQNFKQFGNLYTQQAAINSRLFVVNNNREALTQYIEELSKPNFIQEVAVYDVTGQLIASAGNPTTIKSLYGIDHESENESKRFIPFIEELRDKRAGNRLYGYIRILIEENQLTQSQKVINRDQQQLTRFMLILAGIVGFLLTRGFSRFSRQGYRVAKG